MADEPGNGTERMKSEGVKPSKDTTTNNCGIIREVVQESEPEQTYITAPVSCSDPAGPSGTRISSPEGPRDKGKGHELPSPYGDEGNTSYWGGRESPPHSMHTDESWMQLMDAAQRWGEHAVRAKEEAARQQRELADFNRKVDDNYHRTNEIAEAMISFAQNITSQGIQIQSPRIPFALSHTLARFEATRAPIQVKIEEAEKEIPSPLTINRTEERMVESAIASSTTESK
jgi:hypothetical protein